MPRDFNSCLADGGKVITKTLKGGKYIYLCYPKGGGPAVSGEVKTKEKVPSRNKVKSDIKKEYGV